jgi:hypothetical protein
MGIDRGRVIARRVNLRADHPRMLDAILPHELTHVVMADVFPHEQIPRWADEGIAVMAEPETEQHARLADLAQPLSSGRVFTSRTLMTTEYPHADHWPLYYAQSVSLTRFLIQRGGPERFVEFLKAAQREGIEQGLRRFYQIDGFASLDRAWITDARQRLANEAETVTKR